MSVNFTHEGLKGVYLTIYSRPLCRLFGKKYTNIPYSQAPLFDHFYHSGQYMVNALGLCLVQKVVASH